MTMCSHLVYSVFFLCLTFFFFNDSATPEIYTLSLHDALPISDGRHHHRTAGPLKWFLVYGSPGILWMHSAFLPSSGVDLDRKSTRLNSSHTVISYAVFCLKKKKKTKTTHTDLWHIYCIPDVTT